MSKKCMCSVYDSALQAYATPFMVPSTAYAVRSFSDEVNRQAPDNNLAIHPEDYTLYLLAYFDEDEGVFQAAHQVLVRGKDVVQKSS